MQAQLKTTIRSGVRSENEHLIESCQGLVRNLAWKIHQRLPRQIDLEDLISYGQVGLTEAASRFDETKGTKFSTFAYYRIRGAILDGLKEMAWFSLAEYQGGNYEGSSLIVLEEESTTPSPYADDLEGQARSFADVGIRLAVVYLMSNVEDHSGVSPDAPLIRQEALAVLRQLIEELPDQERQLIRLAYYEELTLKEAGKRIGVSKSWASRLHDRALKILAIGMRDRGT